MESEVEHREVRTEEAAVKMRHRGRHLAAGRLGEPKELARADCGSERKLAAACRKVSRRVRAAWRERNIVRNKFTRTKDERGIRRVRTRHEGRKGVKGLCGGRPWYLKKRDLKNLRRESRGNVKESLRKTTGLEIAKRMARSTLWLRKMRNWTLWRSRPPLERKIKDWALWRGRPTPERKETLIATLA
jgi:hypothetical protein